MRKTVQEWLSAQESKKGCTRKPKAKTRSAKANKNIARKKSKRSPK
jgi:hypothetical protein